MKVSETARVPKTHPEFDFSTDRFDEELHAAQPWSELLNTERRTMKILLQHVPTRLYLKTPGQWVESYREARLFVDTIEAMRCCREHAWSQMRIVLKFPHSNRDIRLPLGPLLHSPAGNGTKTGTGVPAGFIGSR